MENLTRRLNRSSTIKRDSSFHYTINRATAESKPITQNTGRAHLPGTTKPIKIDLNVSNLGQFQNPSPISTQTVNTRRSNRYNTMEIIAGPHEPTPNTPLKEIQSANYNKSYIDIPVDFNSSMGRLRKRFSMHSDDKSLARALSQLDYNSPAKAEKKLNISDEYKNISELSSSQEISLPLEDILEERKQIHKKNSNSFEADHSDKSMNSNSPNRQTIQPRMPKKKRLESIDHTLETDKLPESPPNMDEVPPVFLEFQEQSSRVSVRPHFLSKTEIKYMNFDEALSRFYNLPALYTQARLWYRPCWSFLCCCCRNNTELPQEPLELCEKVIVFAYMGFSHDNIYHLSLLTSVYNTLQAICEVKGAWTEVGFSSNTPYKDDLTHDTAAFGLLLFMFLDKFLPKALEEMVMYSLANEIPFISLAFDIAEITIVTLRKEILNDFIAASQKCLEVLCFFYAGCLIYWFHIHKSDIESHGKINQIVEKIAEKQPMMLINLAKDNLQASFV